MIRKMMIMVGNIGSGKSTYCQKLAKLGYRIVSRDALRYMIGAGAYTFDPSFEQTIYRTDRAIIREFAAAGADIVVDETCMSRAARAHLISIAQEHNMTVEALVMPRLSKKESVDRRMQNPHSTPNREVWEGVWQMFDDMYQEPEIKEGFTYIWML